MSDYLSLAPRPLKVSVTVELVHSSGEQLSYEWQHNIYAQLSNGSHFQKAGQLVKAEDDCWPYKLNQ